MILTRTTKAYAKINLYLDVGYKRPDGYHDIESVMQRVSLFDYVTVIRDTESTVRDIKICCTDKSLPTDGKNIAMKCAAAFLEKYNIDSEITIHIDKRIAVAGGLAGGSADGAAVLAILNFLFEKNVATAELCEIGAAVGADIPFCLVGGTCIARGIGEILTPVRIPHPSYHILICNAGEGISTAEAYAKLDETTNDTTHSIDDVLSSLSAGNIPVKLYNAFERVVLPAHDMASQIKQDMRSHGADAVLMSGSGPSIFGLFQSTDTRDAACEFFTSKGIRALPCEPLSR